MTMNKLVLVLIGVLFHTAYITGAGLILDQEPDNNNNADNNNIAIGNRQLGGSGRRHSCDSCYNCFCKRQCDSRKRFLLDHADCFAYGIDCFGARGHQDGQWSSWEQWGVCTGTCLGGTRMRRRHCTNPPPKNCGAACSGDSTQGDHSCVPDNCQQTSPSTTNSQNSVTTDIPNGVAHVEPTTLDGVFTRCSKLCTVSAVVNELPIVQPNALQCPGVTTGSSEALPLHCCGNLNKRLTQPGVSVMDNCHVFPHYTAVASFQWGEVELGTEGVFVGCLPEPEVGFQLIRQDCDTLPTLVHVNVSQVIYGSPYGYFALV